MARRLSLPTVKPLVPVNSNNRLGSVDPEIEQ